MRTHLEKILDELFATECTLYTSVAQFNAQFTTTLREKQYPVSDERVLQLFWMMEKVEQTSFELMKLFEQCRSLEITIGNCFQKIYAPISTYVLYTIKYREFGDLFRRECQTNEVFRTFLEHAHQITDYSADSYMIMPVQRLPRYRMLLEDMINHITDPSEKKSAIYSLENLKKIITQTDRYIEEIERAHHVAELAARCRGFFLNQPGRVMYYNGPVIKFSQRNTIERYLVIMSDSLIIADFSIANELKLNREYRNETYFIQDVPDDVTFKNAVEIRHATKSFRVTLPSPTEKRSVLEAFDKMIEANNLKKSVIKYQQYAPAWVPATECAHCQTKFSIITHRHPCRNCGCLVCKECLVHSIIPGRGLKTFPVCPGCFTELQQHLIEMGEGII